MQNNILRLFPASVTYCTSKGKGGVRTSEGEGEADGEGVSFRDFLLLVARPRTLVPLFLQMTKADYTSVHTQRT